MTLTASVIVPNLHSPYLGEVLRALRQQTVAPCEVIVVGQDRYGLAHEDGWVQVFPSAYPVSPAIARNTGLAYARGDVCCFLDSDCVPAASWLEVLLEQHMQGYVAVGGSIGLQPQTYWQRCDNIACLGTFLETSAEGERLFLISGNMSVQTSLLRTIGGFNARFVISEDVDMGLRIRRQGHRLWFAPRAVAYHHTPRADAKRVWYHMYAFGSQWPTVQGEHQAILQRSIWEWLYRAAPLLGFMTTPVVALRDVYELYSAQPDLRRCCWSALPGVFWARLGWYAGIMHGLNA